MMKSLYEELGGTYTLGDDGMLYPDLAIGDKDSRPIWKWGRMHMKYLEAEHPGLYERLILKGTLNRHLADANERAIRDAGKADCANGGPGRHHGELEESTVT